MAEVGPEAAETIFQGHAKYAASFRRWLRRKDPELARHTDDDARVVKHDDIYKLHVIWFSDALRDLDTEREAATVHAAKPSPKKRRATRERGMKR
jgi:hypothetical protein